MWRRQIEFAVRRIKEHTGRFGATFPIVVTGMKCLALEHPPARDLREHVVERAIRLLRWVCPQGRTVDKISNPAKADEIVAPHTFLLTPAEKDDEITFGERVPDIPTAHTPTRLSHVSQTVLSCKERGIVTPVIVTSIVDFKKRAEQRISFRRLLRLPSLLRLRCLPPIGAHVGVHVSNDMVSVRVPLTLPMLSWNPENQCWRQDRR